METSTTVEDRTEKDKLALLETLKEMPIIQVACKKAGISRATYYRWRKEDGNFLRQTEISLGQGFEFINDMSESQVIQLIREKKMPAISMWLRHHHPIYGSKSKIETARPATVELTSEEQKIFRKALEFSTGNTKNYGKRNQSKRPAKNIAE